MGDYEGQGEPESQTDYGEILMHRDEARAIYQTELMRQVFRRGVTVENLQPRMVPQLLEAHTEAMLTVLAENNHRIVDLLYQLGLIAFTSEEDAPSGQ